MTRKGKIAVIAYNGIDGSCAAAVALLRFPAAEVIPTSAQRIGVTLASLEGKAYREVHVCGVGVYCDWSDVSGPATA